MRKGTFGHMQNMQTQTSRRVSDAASDQGLHFFTPVTSVADIFLAVYTIGLRIAVFNIVQGLILVIFVMSEGPFPRDAGQMNACDMIFRTQQMQRTIEKRSLLFISYKFVKGFLAITFLLLVISSCNFPNVSQRFLYNQKRNFSLIRIKMRNFPIDSHYKNCPRL